MNIREQLMKKRIESLEGQIKVSIELLGRVLDENEYLASVACGFAWDTATELWGIPVSDCLFACENIESRWDAAVEGAKVEALAREDALRGVQRALDGSITSILPPVSK